MSHQKRGEGTEVRCFTPASSNASVSIGDRGNYLPSHDEDESEHGRPKAAVDRARPKEARTRTTRPTAKRPCLGVIVLKSPVLRRNECR